MKELFSAKWWAEIWEKREEGKEFKEIFNNYIRIPKAVTLIACSHNKDGERIEENKGNVTQVDMNAYMTPDNKSIVIGKCKTCNTIYYKYERNLAELAKEVEEVVRQV